MIDFFTNPEDLLKWVQSQDSAELAISRIVEVIGKDDEQDVADPCREIFDPQDGFDVSRASETLYKVLAKHKICNIREANMSKTQKLTKEAQIMRQPGQYDMPLRICPKLPYSVGKKLISTYNCRHYCLDSITFDDDPKRIYCAETLWRRHIMDKFSREYKNEKGQWVGGYFNERWQTFHDDGGNQMQLAHGERSRKPRPHQYSIERRLEEGRGVETFDIEAAKAKGLIKVASTSHEANNSDDSRIYQIFSDMVEMREEGLSDEQIIMKSSEHYKLSINNIAKIYHFACKQVSRHSGIVYSCDSSKMTKTSASKKKTAKVAYSDVPVGMTFVLKKDIPVVSLTSGMQVSLKVGTKVVSDVGDANRNVMEIVDGPDAGEKISVGNDVDFPTVFAQVDGVDEDGADERLQDGADEVLLNEEKNLQGEQNQPNVMNASPMEDFPIEVN